MSVNLHYTRAVVEDILRQLKGFVPKGEKVEFTIYYDVDDHIAFKAVQTFGEEDQLPPETVPLKL